MWVGHRQWTMTNCFFLLFSFWEAGAPTTGEAINLLQSVASVWNSAVLAALQEAPQVCAVARSSKP